MEVLQPIYQLNKVTERREKEREGREEGQEEEGGVMLQQGGSYLVG